MLHLKYSYVNDYGRANNHSGQRVPLRYFKSNREPMSRRQLARTRYEETEMILNLLGEWLSEP